MKPVGVSHNIVFLALVRYHVIIYEFELMVFQQFLRAYFMISEAREYFTCVLTLL